MSLLLLFLLKLKSKEIPVSTQRRILTAIIATVTALAIAGCRPAQYEIIRKRSGNNDNKPVKPFADPEQNPTNPETPTPAPNSPPTARVEVIWNNESVARVRVNQPVEIRPSADTVDPDDIGTSECANPGIVKAEYEIGAGGDKRLAERPQGCESLGVPYTFTSPGNYQISMIVTSNEEEPAWASITLLVYDGPTPPPSDGDFTIRAHPMLAGVGQVVSFWGTCTLGRTQIITWQFGDGGSATGRVVTHAYQAPGQYQVDATCTDESGRSQSAKLTIVVVTEPLKIPGVPEPIIPNPNAPVPGTPIGPGDGLPPPGGNPPPGGPPGKGYPPPYPAKKPPYPGPAKQPAKHPAKQPGAPWWKPW